MYDLTCSPNIDFIEFVWDAMALLSKVMDVRLEQPEKAELPMLVTLFGMVMEVRLVQPWKA